MRQADLIGKRFKRIEDSKYGGIALEFEDGTIAYYSVITFPDGTVREVYFDNILNTTTEEEN